jgi:hypothetical protein
MKTWMKHAGLWDAASTRERILLEKPLGSWSRQEIADGQWREESLTVLLWALRPDMTMPSYDEQAFQSEVMSQSLTRWTVRHLSLTQNFEIRRISPGHAMWLNSGYGVRAQLSYKENTTSLQRARILSESLRWQLRKAKKTGCLRQSTTISLHCVNLMRSFLQKSGKGCARLPRNGSTGSMGFAGTLKTGTRSRRKHKSSF